MYDKSESQVTLASARDVVGGGKEEKARWLSKRSRLETVCLVFVGFLLLLVLSLGVSLGIVATHTRPITEVSSGSNKISAQESRGPVPTWEELGPKYGDYCFTKGCIETAAEILEKLDETVDPCDDFYEFACGNYIKDAVIPDDKSQVSMFSELGDKLTEQVRGLLQGDITAAEPKPFRLVKSLYQSCMNQGMIEQRGLTTLKNILKKLGGWPLLEGENWDQEGFRWFNMVYKFREVGFSVDYLVDFSVTADLRNSSWRILDLDQPPLGLSREFLVRGVEDKNVQAYFTFMKDVAILLGADKDEAEDQMKKVLEFEIQVANISLPREQRRDARALYNPMTISQLSQLDPSTPWLEYINTLLSPGIVQADLSETIIVDVPSYIQGLSSLTAATPPSVQANYLIWRAVAASIPYLTEAADRIGLQLTKALTGQAEKPPRWKICVGAATGSLGAAVGSLYVSKYFKEKSKVTAEEMVTEIRKEFMKMLGEVEWMDESTKERAKVKANAMVEHIGYPSELQDMKKLEGLYKGLELSADDYFGNGLNISTFGTDYSFSKLREKVNKTDWEHHANPAVVNAFYSPLENSIQFPAGILQGVFFSSDRPRYMNYGAIGWVIGHEITHGFDDQGRQFDQDGNLVNWWHPETAMRYLDKAECIIKQYSNYSFPHLGNLAVSGINTQGENIADNGGIKEAYKAYESWVSRHGPEQLLPGLQYSQAQLLWLSGAQVWCSKHRDQALHMMVLTGAHSPDRFRVQGAFSNMEDFARDFNCKAGTRMNPYREQKCKVW